MSLSRYPRYPAYKDSGVEWLGEVPTHWEVPKMWHVSKAVSGGTPNRDESRFWDGDIPWVSPKDMKRLVIDSSEDSITEAALTESGLRLVPPQAILVVVRGMILAHTFPVAVTSVPVTINQDMKAIHFTNAIDPMFAARYLEGTGSRLLSVIVDEAAHGTKAIRMDQWRGVTLLHPPLDEQRAITDFLDRETARIDALIEKKRRLIELLQEQRAAIITRAVTRGLDPHAPMKDSGVEWLGEIPVHWRALRLKQLLAQIEQGWSPDCENRIAAPEEWGVMKAGCVNGGRFNQMEHKTLPAEVYPPKSLEIRPGDLLMSRASGSRELVGSVAVVRECRSQLLLCDKLFRLYPDEQNDARYLANALSSKSARAQIEVALSGGSGMANNIAQSVVKDLLLGVPDREEQERIANFLDHETTRFDSVMKVVCRAMDQLLDLRSSLITAAVTGAIDVRASLDADARIDAA